MPAHVIRLPIDPLAVGLIGPGHVRIAGEAVVVKVSKPNHDFRFDIPCIGSRTLDSCAAGKIVVLAIEAGKTLLLEKEKILQAADKQGLRIVAV